MTLRRAGLYALLVVLPAATAAGLAEAYVRLFDGDGYYTPETLRRSASLHYQPAVYARHIFPARERTIRGWFGNEWRINAKGYRGPDFATEKPPGTRRIIIYGGSSVFNSGMTEGRDWPRQVETLLRGWGLGPVEVINAGIPGHAGADAVGRLLTEGHVFAPDIVMLYTGWNDIKQFHLAEPVLRQMRPWKEGLDPRLYYRGGLDKALSETSQLYVRLRQGYWRWRLDAGPEGARTPIDRLPAPGRVVDRATANEFGFYDAGPRQFALNAAAFVDIARAIGAVPVLAKQARLGDPRNTPNQKKRIRYAFINLDHRGYLEAYARMDRVLEVLSEAKSVLLIDAASYVPRDLDHFLDHVHLRPAGAEALARVVAEHLRSVLKAMPGGNGGGGATATAGSSPHRLAGLAWRRLGRRAAAAHAFARAAELHPSDPAALYDAGLALQQAGKFEESSALLARLAEADPGYRDALFLLGYAHQKAGRRTEAIAAYRRFLDRRPSHAQTRFNLGYALRYAGDCKAAVAQFQRYLALQPAGRAAHHHLSECYRTLGDEERASLHARRYRGGGQ